MSGLVNIFGEGSAPDVGDLEGSQEVELRQAIGTSKGTCLRRGDGPSNSPTGYVVGKENFSQKFEITQATDLRTYENL
jgi:hypothetical protein